MDTVPKLFNIRLYCILSWFNFIWAVQNWLWTKRLGLTNQLLEMTKENLMNRAILYYVLWLSVTLPPYPHSSSLPWAFFGLCSLRGTGKCPSQSLQNQKWFINEICVTEACMHCLHCFPVLWVSFVSHEVTKMWFLWVSFVSHEVTKMWFLWRSPENYIK